MDKMKEHKEQCDEGEVCLSWHDEAGMSRANDTMKDTHLFEV